MTRGRRIAEVATAVVVAALGAYLWWGASQVDFGSGYDRIGPRFFPHAVAGGLLVLGAVLLLFRRHGHHVGRVPEVPPEPPINWTPLAYLALSLGAYVPLVAVAGFMPASAVQFVIVARAFHSRRPLRDLLIGIVIAAVVFVAFSKGLGLALPEGPIERRLQP